MDYRTIQPSIGSFNMPTNLVVSRDGDLFVIENFSCRGGTAAVARLRHVRPAWS
ncbi:uncharacterized protein METZ01_LOCUS230738, partial [marine metagenome]